MDQMHLRMQPSGAQLGHIPSAPVTEVQRLGKHGSQQQQVAPAPVVNTVLSSSTGGTGIHVDSPSALSGAGSIVANSAAEVAPAAKPGRPAPSTVPHPLDRNPDDPSLKPDETEFIREQIRYEWQGHVVECEALYHSSTPKRVIDTIGDKLSCDMQFNCSRRLALSNLHVLSRGRPPFLRLRPAGGASAEATFQGIVDAILVHERDPPLPVTTVADGAEVFEIMFVPVFDLSATHAPGGGWNYQRRPCFWCYRVVPGSVAAGIKWLTMYRMPVVLDLDDTLVVANGETALRDKRDKCRMMMYKVKSALEEGMDDDDSKAMAKTRELMLEEEVKLLETDLRMLREYIDSDRCIDENGKEHIAVKETAFTDLNCQVLIKRPIIRMMRGEDFVTVFTRIDPNNAATSMIIRVRAGWEKLKAELMAPVDATIAPADAQVRKWDTYICTAAEQPYALEVYRLLDPEGEVISKIHLKHHLVCVSRDNKKSLRAALHHPLDVNRYQHAVNSLVDPDDVDRDDGVDEDDMGASGVPTMSIAIIVDDRMDVWEAAVRDQLVMAAPFNHYPTCAAAAVGEGSGPSRRGHDEMARILNYLRGLRRDLFHFWDNCVGVSVRAVLERGVPNAFFALDMHAIMSASPYVNVNSMEPSAPLPMPADAAGHISNQDSLALAPVDPRKRREQSQQAQQQGMPAPNLIPAGMPHQGPADMPAGLPGPPQTSQPLPPVPPQPFSSVQLQATLPGPPQANSVPFVSPGALAATANHPGQAPFSLPPRPPLVGGGSALPQDPRRSRAAAPLPPPPLSSAPTVHLPPGMSDLPPAPARAGAPTAPSAPGLGAPPGASGVPGLQVALPASQAQTGTAAAPSWQHDATEHDERLSKIYDAPEPPSLAGDLVRMKSDDDWTKSGSYEMIYGAPKDEGPAKGQVGAVPGGTQHIDHASDDGEITDDDQAPAIAADRRGHPSAGKKAARVRQDPVEAAGWGTGAYNEDQAWEEDEDWDGSDEPQFSEAEVQEKLWTLGQGGLPFVVVAAEEQPDGTVRHRPVRVQQNPIINSWAQFMQPGDVVPAISVDPDPAKRPECIVIRMDQTMVDQKCALNQNYHEMLSQKMQQNYQFNTPMGGSYSLPPWVLLDLDSQRHAVTDLFYSFSTKHAPMPPLPKDLIMSAMEQWSSFYLRHKVPDFPANTPFTVGAEAAARRGPLSVSEAAEALQKLMAAKPGKDETIVPVNIPQPQMNELCQKEAASPSGWVDCMHGHPGPQQVALLHLPVGHDDAMKVHYAMRAVPSGKPVGRQPGKVTRMPSRDGSQAHGPAHGGDTRQHSGMPTSRGSPGLPRPPSGPGRKHGSDHAKRDDDIDDRPRRPRVAAAAASHDIGHAQLHGPGYSQVTASTSAVPTSKDHSVSGPGFFAGAVSSKGAARLSNMLWRDQDRSTNATQFLYQRAQLLARKVCFVDRTIDNGGEKVNEMKVYVGNEQDPLGQGRARTKKEAKRLAAIAAHEILDIEVTAMASAAGESSGRTNPGQAPATKGGQRGRAIESEEAPSSTGKRKRAGAGVTAPTAATASTWKTAASSTGGYGAVLASMTAGYGAGLRVLSGGKDATAGASTKGYGGASGGVNKIAKIVNTEPRISSVAKPATGGYGGTPSASVQNGAGMSNVVVDKAWSSGAAPAAVAAPPHASSPGGIQGGVEAVIPNKDVSAGAAAHGVSEGQDSDEEEGEIR